MYVLNTLSQTLSFVNLQNFTSDNSFSQIGLHGNHVVYHEDKLYVVNSGDATVQIINPDIGATIGNIFLENSSNPWHIAIQGNFAYITGLYSDKLYRVDLRNMTNISEIVVGIGPAGLKIHGDYIYVAVSGFAYFSYEQAKVCKVDINTFSIVGEIDVATNLQDLIVHNSKIYGISTGNYIDQKSVVTIIDTITFSIVDTVDFDNFLTTIQLGQDGLLYMSEYLGQGFFTLNIETFEISGPVFPNGQSILFDEEYFYVLVANWGGNSTLSIYTHDYQFVNSISTGVGSNWMTFRETATSIADTTIPKPVDIFAYPNPFNSSVSFQIVKNDVVKSEISSVKMQIYNLKGQKVFESAKNDLIWHGRDFNDRELPSGIYFAKITIEDSQIIKKIVRMKP
jgi:DNA-binding beta-propeller fold protein YncE